MTGARVIFEPMDGRWDAAAALRAGFGVDEVRAVVDGWAERTEALSARHDVAYV